MFVRDYNISLYERRVIIMFKQTFLLTAKEKRQVSETMGNVMLGILEGEYIGDIAKRLKLELQQVEDNIDETLYIYFVSMSEDGVSLKHYLSNKQRLSPNHGLFLFAFIFFLFFKIREKNMAFYDRKK